MFLASMFLTVLFQKSYQRCVDAKEWEGRSTLRAGDKIVTLGRLASSVIRSRPRWRERPKAAGGWRWGRWQLPGTRGRGVDGCRGSQLASMAGPWLKRFSSSEEPPERGGRP